MVKVTASWKSRQKAFYSTNKTFDDSISNNEIILLDSDEEIINKAIEYFYKDQQALYYPSKSYCVALIYSQLLSLHFKVDATEALNDPDLLYNNDPYFKVYDESKHIYNSIIDNLPRFFWESSTKSVRKTVQCFYEEFGLTYSM